VRGAWERRHRDVRKSDFREDPVRELPHLGRIRDEDAGNVTPSGPEGPSRAQIKGVENALSTFGPP